MQPGIDSSYWVLAEYQEQIQVLHVYEAISESAQPQASIIIYSFIINFIIILLLMLINIIIYRQVIEGTGRIENCPKDT